MPLSVLLKSRRYGQTLSIGPNWVGFAWRQEQNPVSKTVWSKWVTGWWIILGKTIVIIMYHHRILLDLILKSVWPGSSHAIKSLHSCTNNFLSEYELSVTCQLSDCRSSKQHCTETSRTPQQILFFFWIYLILAKIHMQFLQQIPLGTFCMEFL